jgi:uncharacterized protein
METTDRIIESICGETGIDSRRIHQTVKLLEEGGTIPFIARYRKEVTGSLDEVQITAIRDRLEKHRELEKRKKAVLSSLQERKLLSEELHKKIDSAGNLTLLEDIYLPFRPKRRTRAIIARERGLEPLAQRIMQGGVKEGEAREFLSKETGVNSIEEALAGARDIVAEVISEDAQTRSHLRRIFKRDAIVVSTLVKKNKEQAFKFKDYFDWQEAASGIAGHRLLALFRGESLKMLKLSIRPPDQNILKELQNRYLARQQHNQQLLLAVEDSYSRLLAPSLENELRKEMKMRADTEAIEVFVTNLRELLLAAPLGQKRVMALDPGYRTGAKLVCLNEQGLFLHNDTVYPTFGGKKAQDAATVIKKLAAQYNIGAIAIGNGTAGRETEEFVRRLGLAGDILITLVNEDGASIYSASKTARDEFPDHDITVRGAVSIGRRLQDPLAELVKIEAKSIGVGQYQHDVDQGALKKSLEEVVVSCVNSVGVEVNSASGELLSYVAGLGPVLAANIIQWRHDNGPFNCRKDLMKVTRLGAKAYEQCAGFLRIRNSSHPLDGSGVHPERYRLVDRMAKDHDVTIEDLLRLESARKSICLENYLDDSVGMETLVDIMAELARPGRDPREEFTHFQFDDTVHSMEDIREGMILPAVITNVTKFGAFADIGVKQDGLIHISQLADRFVKDPSDIVKVQQRVKVRVLEVDLKRKRIGLSLRM